MRLLLDTHVFLWWWFEQPELPASIRELLADENNEVWFSAAVGWEIVIKRALGKLEFDGSVAAAVAGEGFELLPIRLAHTDEIGRLPLHHRDPFDRILIAQARVERLVLVTVDPVMDRYDGFTRFPAVGRDVAPTTTG